MAVLLRVDTAVREGSLVEREEIANHLVAFVARTSILALVDPVLESFRHASVELLIGHAVREVLGRKLVTSVLYFSKLRLNKKLKFSLVKVETTKKQFLNACLLEIVARFVALCRA
jgi:hypothetical protein